jgi:hypothetical protein
VWRGFDQRSDLSHIEAWWNTWEQFVDLLKHNILTLHLTDCTLLRLDIDDLLEDFIRVIPSQLRISDRPTTSCGPLVAS